MAKYWWKIVATVILLYVIVAGILIEIPYLPKLKESIRNLFYHVPMWYVMLFSFLMSVIYSVLYLRSNKLKHDIISNEFVIVGLCFGSLGMLTGMEWAYIQWGAPWSNDPKQVGAALTLLIYLAYTILRNSLPDPDKRARLASVYNIFSFALLIPLVYIIPSHLASLHPGSDNKPFEALKTQDSLLRYVSIPAMLGWILLGLWIFDIRLRIKKIESPEIFTNE
ncbi:MAG: cytochrome c biogenesis protein CcsA [Bacteroidetes bacterium]|nr:cytochrome c biogenesis protein CcsA [Bacteroidota bacterium]MBK8144912.1 cytochrome c biogenesis protein CcsA [Bacteroidota bacterium]MBP6315685.1 cytochrome c biogenesis protein CcsA [Chitinophagaceae bacterium]